MKTILHKAEDREKVSFGWLNSYHSFSFGHYYDPEKIHFGALRVLNDDTIEGGTGFGKHPHDNMEIISIPITGALQHEDSAGNKAVIYKNDVQIMSAGTGIQHSEKNHLANETTNFLQIWVIPGKRNITPRYGQKTFNPDDRNNSFQTVVAPDDDTAVWINQDAWLSLTNIDKDVNLTYTPKKPGNGVYVLVLSGAININGQDLKAKDALGIWEVEDFTLSGNQPAEVLLIDVPMLQF